VFVLRRPAALAWSEGAAEGPFDEADERHRAERAPGMGAAADSLCFGLLVRGVDEKILPRCRGPFGAPEIQIEHAVGVSAAAVRRGTGPRMVLGRRYHSRSRGVTLDVAEGHPEVRLAERAGVVTALPEGARATSRRGAGLR
jgi:hypothetical protein